MNYALAAGDKIMFDYTILERVGDNQLTFAMMGKTAFSGKNLSAIRIYNGQLEGLKNLEIEQLFWINGEKILRKVAC